MESRLVISGFGGQGVLFIGNVIAQSALIMDKFVTWLPSYGAEMRGGAANCTIVISDEEIPSPCVEYPDAVIALNAAAMEKFESSVKSKGLMIINSSLATLKPSRNDVDYIFIPATEIAKEAGDIKCANIVALGAYLEKTKVMNIESIKEVLQKLLAYRKKDSLILTNINALNAGAEYVRNMSSNNCGCTSCSCSMPGC
jgi:2-oxoglutarate ferredoxin oxidoreductase subunit gamma